MMTKYKCVVADPPWPEHGGGKSTRGAQRHYPLMKKEEIFPVIDDNINAAKDCHLWMWYTDNHLQDCLWVIDQLGFRFIRTMVWVKASEATEPGDLAASWQLQRFGLGQYLRSLHESCALAVKGNGRSLVQNRDVGSVIMAPRGRHSEKPAAAYAAIERVSPGPRLEMFARGSRLGWDTWGDEEK